MNDRQEMAPVAGARNDRGFVKLLFGRSLAECLDSGRDNILQLRLLAALVVLFGHSYVLCGASATRADPVNALLPRTYTHLLGVMMFFLISGFLITLSWERRPQLGRFIAARALRLWPALLVNVVLWAFVLGPTLSVLPLKTYFLKGDSFGSAYAYAYGNASLADMRWFLPGVFIDNPVKRYVNGSLWTIPVEASMYLCVAVAGISRVLSWPRVASLLILAAIGYWMVWPDYTGHMPVGGTTWLGHMLMGFFGAGSVACLLRRRVYVSTFLMLCVSVACLLTRTWSYGDPFLWLALGYFVLWFAYVPRIPAIPWNLDLSYGTYLWAFPVQQVLTMTGMRDPWLLSAAAVLVVLPIALASWLLVEKPALRFKRTRSQPPATVAVPDMALAKPTT
jgi:peptidoglycan/LPS O-acetylase OafA/YrhL